MNLKELFHNIIHRHSFRRYVFASVSLSVNVAFAIYNLILGILFGLVWNFSMFFYYLLSMSIKAVVLLGEPKGETLTQSERAEKQKKLFRIEKILLLCLDFALLAPIVLLLLQEKQTVDIGTIPAIAMAAFTTYKIVIACINYTKSPKNDSQTLHGLKIINLKEAVLSVITLQNTMVYVFGDANEMFALTFWTTIGMYLSTLILTLCQFSKKRNPSSAENKSDKI